MTVFSCAAAGSCAAAVGCVAVRLFDCMAIRKLCDFVTVYGCAAAGGSVAVRPFGCI